MSGLIRRDDVLSLIVRQHANLLSAANEHPSHASLLKDMAGWWSDLAEIVRALPEEGRTEEHL